jgi:hypothetical protein
VGIPLGALREPGKDVGKVAADGGTELGTLRVGSRAADLHSIDDAAAITFQTVDPVNGPHHKVPELDLVDEQLRLDRLRDARSIGSSPTGVIEMMLPGAKGPTISMCSMSAFHSGQLGTSRQSPQIASGEALVSMLCSVVHTPVSLPSFRSFKAWRSTGIARPSMRTRG